MAILGLDISTSCTGWCLLSDDGKIVDIGYVDISKKGSLFEKALEVENCIANLSNSYTIQDVYIEENLQSFRSGFSSAQTISTLAKFNGIVSFICFKVFKVEPVFFNVNSARKMLGIKIVRKKDGGAPTKDQLRTWAEENVNYAWPVKVLKSGPRKGLTVPDPRSYDMIDAYIVCKAGLQSCK